MSTEMPGRTFVFRDAARRHPGTGGDVHPRAGAEAQERSGDGGEERERRRDGGGLGAWGERQGVQGYSVSGSGAGNGIGTVT